MPISDDQVTELLESNERIEREQKRHGRTLYGDDEYAGLRAIVGQIKAQLDALDGKVTGYEDRVKGAKWVIAGFLTLVGSGAIAMLIKFVSGG